MLPDRTSVPCASPHTLALIHSVGEVPLNVIPWLDSDAPFPSLDSALVQPNGLLAAGADLSPARIVDAYRQGIFPWYSEGQPILWWSPDPRMVLYVSEFEPSRSLVKRIRRRDYEVRIDTAFDAVIEACASAPRGEQNGTWITGEMARAYRRLHALRYAHSVEAWREGELVGGLYGLALGKVFFGESMFAHATDASKVCLAALVALLQHREVALIDCQQETPHLASLGARPISRRRFARHLRELIDSNAAPSGWTAAQVSEFR
jgi:leucyl/phenylalanyl-tRNA--protein transferase